MMSRSNRRPEDIVLICLVLIALLVVLEMRAIRHRYHDPRLEKDHELVLLNVSLNSATHTVQGTVFRHIGSRTGLRNARIIIDIFGPGHALLAERTATSPMMPGSSWHFEVAAPVNTAECTVQRLEFQ